MIESLQDQVEWFRLQAGTPLLKPRPKQDEATESIREVLDQPWKDELEEDLEHMARQHLINKQELESALAHVGAMSTTIDFD